MLKGFIASRTVNVLNRQNATIITQLKTKMIRHTAWNGFICSFFM